MIAWLILEPISVLVAQAQRNPATSPNPAIPPKVPQSHQCLACVSDQSCGVYTAPAQMARAAGSVLFEVTIDERGAVISARPLSGHELLKLGDHNLAIDHTNCLEK